MSKDRELRYKVKPDVKDDYIVSRNYISVDDITIVIPTLNEQAAIGLVLERILQEGFEKIMVIDGESTDDTLEVVKRYRIDHITQEGKGKTGAIKTAISNIRTPYFVVLDGDCTYSAKNIEDLLSNAGNKSELIGARKKGRENISTLNRFGNWVINKIFNLIFGTKLTDVCSGMYLLNTQFAKKLMLETEGFDVEVEIAAYAAYNNSIGETPIEFLPRVGVQKLRPFRDGTQIMYRIFKLGLKFYPTRVLCLLSISLLLPGLFFIGLHFFGNPQFQSFFAGILMVTLAIQGTTLYIVDTKINRIDKK